MFENGNNDTDDDDDDDGLIKNSTMTNYRHVVLDHGGILPRAYSHHTITDIGQVGDTRSCCTYGDQKTYSNISQMST